MNNIIGVRKLDNREKFQYKLILENGKEIQFRNFLELRFYSTINLRGKGKHMILTRSDKIVNR